MTSLLSDLPALQSRYTKQTAEKLFRIGEETSEIRNEEDRTREQWGRLVEAFPDPDQFIQHLFFIRPMEGGTLVRFRYNDPQKRLVQIIRQQQAEKKPVRVIICKARQIGFSTLSQAVLCHLILTRAQTVAKVIAHDDSSASWIFGMSQTFLDTMPVHVATKVTRAQRLQTVQGSEYSCLSASAKSRGRSFTIHGAHLSELAYYQNADQIYQGLMQAVPDRPGTIVIIESTANGTGNLFHDLWQDAIRGLNDFIPFFVPWFERPDAVAELTPTQEEKLATDLSPEEQRLMEQYHLSLAQLAWRRDVIRNKCANDLDQFHQDYPAYADEAFLSSGRPVFNQFRIQELMALAQEPQIRGILTWQ